MGRYIVRFKKRVLGNHGQEMDQLQYAYETTANDAVTARQRAEQEFCHAHQLSCWQNHADHVEVLSADFPS